MELVNRLSRLRHALASIGVILAFFRHRLTHRRAATLPCILDNVPVIREWIFLSRTTWLVAGREYRMHFMYQKKVRTVHPTLHLKKQAEFISGRIESLLNTFARPVDFVKKKAFMFPDISA